VQQRASWRGIVKMLLRSCRFRLLLMIG